MNQSLAQPTPAFLTLTCPSCGGKLKITAQIHLLVCGHCGNEHFVHRDGGAIYLAPMAQDVRQIRVGVDKTAAELAVSRLTKETADLSDALQTIEQMQINDWIPPGEWERWSLGLAGVTGLIALIVSCNSPGAGFFFMLVGIGLFVAYVKTNDARTKSAHAQRDTEISDLKLLLAERNAALTKNRRIAES